MSRTLLPVIYYLDLPTTLTNVALVERAGCEWVTLIHMQGQDELLDPAIGCIRAQFPSLKIAVNRLSCNALEAIEANIAAGAHATWADNCGVSSQVTTELAHAVSQRIAKSTHRFFGSVAFKYQAYEPAPALAAFKASQLGFVPTTSGSATGSAPNVAKIADMAAGLPPLKLAVASGITPENVAAYLPYVGFYFVSTGICRDFHNFDPLRLNALQQQLR